MLVVGKHIAIPFHQLFPLRQQIQRLFSIQGTRSCFLRRRKVDITGGGLWCRSPKVCRTTGSRRPGACISKLIVGDVCGISISYIRVVHLHQNIARLTGYLEEALLQGREAFTVIAAVAIDVNVIPPVGHFNLLNPVYRPIIWHLVGEEAFHILIRKKNTAELNVCSRSNRDPRMTEGIWYDDSRPSMRWKFYYAKDIPFIRFVPLLPHNRPQHERPTD